MRHPELGEIESVQSPRARYVRITVRPTGEVRLVRPRGVAEQQALAFLDTKVAWVVRTRARLAARLAARPRPAAPSPAAEQARIEQLRREARADLPPRIERLARATGLRYVKLTLRAMRSRWGSCTARNHISLSIFLMTLPEHLRDFVIVHELCHTVHHNHSPRFHALVDRHTGGREQALARELRRCTLG